MQQNCILENLHLFRTDLGGLLIQLLVLCAQTKPLENIKFREKEGRCWKMWKLLSCFFSGDLNWIGYMYLRNPVYYGALQPKIV